MSLSRDVREFLAAAGRKGGRARGRRLTPAARTAAARTAALARWMRHRFDTDSFASLGLPGGELVDRGLRRLAAGDLASPEALAVAELRPRLRFLGVPVPAVAAQVDGARERLYRTLEATHGALAHARFHALLERLDSFCDAFAATRPRAIHAAHRARRWMR
jgi:hypothetical protein